MEKNETMKVEYRRDLQHSYLVVHIPDGQEEETYALKMITKNTISGLLKCDVLRMDNERLYYYDLTSRISLAQRWAGGKADGEDVLAVIFAFLNVLENMEEYLLSAESVYLKLEQIYADAGMEIIEFCYVPGQQWELETQFRELMEEILPLLDHKNQRAVICVYDLYHYVVQEGISAEGLRERLEEFRKESEKTRDDSGYKKKEEEENCEWEEDDMPDEHREKLETREQEWTRQKRHEEALNAFFQDDESEERKSPPVWITFGAAFILAYVLSGWYLWRNFPHLLMIWVVCGGVFSGAAAMFIRIQNKRNKREETEVEEREDREDEESYEEPWEEINFEDNDHMTRILRREIKFQAVLEEKYPQKGREICLGEEEIQFVGTMKEKVELLLPSQAVSRIHARIRKDGDMYYIRDMNSRNGTWINGEVLEGEREYRLEADDEIRFADLIYRFLIRMDSAL